MKKIFWASLLFLLATAQAADVKISQLPLGVGSAVGVNDSFPFVSANVGITKRLTLWDLINLPPIVSTYAPKASPVFSGTSTFGGPVSCSNTLSVTGTITSNSVIIGSAANRISGLSSIVNTGTLTLPTLTDTLIGRATTDTLTNKTLSSATNTISLTANTFSGQLPIAQGGTGQATANTALNALLPSQASANGKVLGSNGTDTSWVASLTDPMTTIGDIIIRNASNLTARLGVGSANQVLGVSSGVPAWKSYTAPTVQNFTTGSGTYTTPANVLYLRVRIVGGGGGGGGAGGTGGTGGTTTFGTTFLTANGGAGGQGAVGNQAAGGPGGTASLASPAVGFAQTGSGGGSGLQPNGIANAISGAGGSSPFGGAGAGTAGITNGPSAAANSGSGGAGGAASSSGLGGNGGGGAGGYVDVIVPSPSATYAYSIGAAGTAGASGGIVAGGSGGDGFAIIEEHYQ